MSTKSTVVIGGGAIGLFSAYYLRRLGHEVTIIDKASIPGIHSCSSGNAGLIVPSHFVPLASPGVLREGLRNLIRPSAPFGISWSFNPDLFGWLYQFVKNSGNRTLASKTILLAELNRLSRELYREIQEKQNINLTLNLSGLFMVSQKEATFKKDISTAGQSMSLCIPAEIWSAQKYRELNNGLDPHVAGAVFYPWDGKVDPLPMLNHLKQWLKNNEVIFLENSSVINWVKQGSEIRSLILSNGELMAHNYLVCAGDQSAEILHDIGLSVPLQPAKGFSYVFKNEQVPVSHPTLLQDAHVAITPYDLHTRVAGNFLLGNRRNEIPQYRLDSIYTSVRNAYPTWNIPHPEIRHSWSGNRPVSPDGIPMIGKSSIYKNLAIATGHAMMGISLAPVSGSIIAGMIDGSGTYPEFQQFLAPARFGNRF